MEINKNDKDSDDLGQLEKYAGDLNKTIREIRVKKEELKEAYLDTIQKQVGF